ncbi:MAG: sulfatase-like hydrolase/transferase [Verrucomicrobiota bacterium]|nr:sulfatase-like hydrolase/transferase [Verrucomicrobiota bacterium]
MTDQHRPDGLGLFGDSYAKTPALDQLAQEGMAFRKTYCQYPLCVPARTSIVLGRYSHSISSGTWGNKIRNPEQTSFLELLQTAGWKTACFGKLHIHQRKQDWTMLNELKKWKSMDKAAEAKHLAPVSFQESFRASVRGRTGTLWSCGICRSPTEPFRPLPRSPGN